VWLLEVGSKTDTGYSNHLMPPRFAYWTILIDGQPTAFRARDQQDLLTTLHQLKRTNKDVLLRWFARGRLWESQQQEREARRQRKAPSDRPRGRDWRPGGQHADPRARFNKKRAEPRRDREQTRMPRRPSGTRPPAGAPRKESGRRFGNRPPGGRGRKR
jgi:hypothetical protein